MNFITTPLMQFIVIGVVKDTPVYTQVRNDQIRIFDVIESVNDTPCHKIFLPGMDVQERFEHSIQERVCVKLELNHCITLPPVSSPLAFGKLVKNYYSYLCEYTLFLQQRKNQ